MDEAKLALELNKVVHNECKDVPQDIGLRLLDVVKKHIGEQLNLPPVSISLQDRLFKLANDFAIAKQGEIAVKLHTIHNGLL